MPEIIESACFDRKSTVDVGKIELSIITLSLSMSPLCELAVMGTADIWSTVRLEMPIASVSSAIRVSNGLASLSDGSSFGRWDK